MNADGFERPEILLVSLFVLLVVHFGKIKLRFSASAMAIGAGIIMGWALGYMSFGAVTEPFNNIGFYMPKLSIGLLSGSLSAAIYELMLGKIGDPSVGYAFLGKGSMFIAIIYSYVACSIVDREWKKASVAFILASVLSSFGLMHLDAVAFPPVLNNFTFVYLGLAAAFFALSYIIKETMFEENQE